MSRLLTVQAEAWKAALAELRPVFLRHWHELGYHHDAMPLAPCWDTFEAQDARGNLLLVTLRDGRALAGYCITFVVPELHHATSKAAVTDSFYVLPEYRGRMGGRRLMRQVENELRRRGVVRWLVGVSERGDGARLMACLGFASIQTTYAKVLATQRSEGAVPWAS